MCINPDGSIIAVGQDYKKISSTDGSVLWQKAFGSTIYFGFAITPTSDGGFIIAGAPQNGLLKINANGDTIWSRKYGDGGTARAIVPTQDGNLFVAGVYNPTGSAYPKLSLMKIKLNGDTIWTRTYDAGLETSAYAITQSPEGNFIIAGEIYNQGIYLVKVNSNGDTVWTKAYLSLPGPARAIKPTLDGNFIVTGPQQLLKIGSNGDTIWTRTCGLGTAVAQTTQGDFVIAENLGVSSSSGGTSVGWLFCLVDDKYAYKGFSFTYKIPTYGDSLKYTFAPKRVPYGMTVSSGGTISWTPITDSSYKEHDTFFVANQTGKLDTLAMNIIVNSEDVPNSVINPSISSKSSSKPHGIVVTSYSSLVSFSLPVKSATLGIYDIHGRFVAKLPVVNGTAVWRGTGRSDKAVSAGRYFARVAEGTQDLSRAFVLVR
jgi:predicted Rdx family selenoprotein